MQGPRTTFIYLAVVFGLLVVPRALQRTRLPAPLTCFAFGIIVAGFFKPLINDSVISYLATLGIASLFLFAGLEVDLAELRRQLPSLAGHFAVRGLVLVGCARLAAVYLHLGWQVDWLLALALLTPSTGFILDMLPHSGLDHVEQSEVALHAIAGEVTAVFLFLVISQADSVKTLLMSGGAIILLIAFMPLVFLALGRFVVPYAPGALVASSLLYGFALAAIVIPVRLGVVWLQSRLMQHRGHRGSLRVSIALTPTLIFTLVIAEILRENFSISPALYGGLLVYAAIASILPSLALPAFAESPVNPIAVEA